MRPRIRIARESDGLTFALRVEDSRAFPGGASRVFVGGPLTMDPKFYTSLRRKTLVRMLTNGKRSLAEFETPR